MSLRTLNVRTLELDEDEPLDRAGFRHRGVSIGERIGAERLGAAVYEAEAGHPIWPYHYHHAIEEWLYVVSGEPVLRDAGGERQLAAGDLVCFPPGHTGAHTTSGPGRLIMLSTDAPGPYIAVYPDSDKVAVAVEPGNALVLPRGASVDYWHGEGSEGLSAPVEPRRERAAPRRPVMKTLTEPAGTGLGEALGGRRVDVSVVELEPGQADDYSYAYGREEWVLVLAGTPALRHADGDQVLAPADLVCFPEGPSGAHRLVNHGDQAVRMLVLSTAGFPVNVAYPDTGTWVLRNAPGREAIVAAGK